MDKQQLILEYIKIFPGQDASIICSEINRKKLVKNPHPPKQIPYPLTLEELAGTLDYATTFKIQQTKTWEFILKDFNSGETRFFIPNLNNLLGGGIINQSQYNNILKILTDTLNRTIDDPNYEPEIYLSDAEVAGHEFIYTHEIQEVMDLSL